MSTFTVEREMDGGRPPSDPLAMERARARAEAKLFGQADPPRLGRYVIEEPIASGGMGVVFSAYDPELDRNVALKVVHLRRVHDLDEGQQRLVLEARALAKLDHPNIVKVHDVLTSDGQVVIVMELVDGVTLEVWAAEQRRTWREVVGVYCQAAAGLAAAHALGIVHRDFKPTNAIIGRDGRVRVLDFGLARSVSDVAPLGTVPHPKGRSLTFRTETGAVMGTFAFAAPEQLSGTAVTAAADLFSLCVALHRVLEGVAPFSGNTTDELIASITAGKIHEGSRRDLPTWLRTAIRRNLAADISHRHPSMTALISELSRARGWLRWRTPALAVAMAAASALVARAASSQSDVLPCDGGHDQLSRAWTAETSTALHGRFGAETMRLADTWTRTWATTHARTCQAVRRSSISPALADRSATCLVRRLRDFEHAVEVLRVDPPVSADRAVEALAALAQPSLCGDVTWLASSLDPPASAPMAARAEVLRDDLATATTLYQVGRTTAALEVAAATVEKARELEYGPVLSEALLAHGRFLTVVNNVEEAEHVLTSAMNTALKNGLIGTAVQAGARKVFASGRRGDISRVIGEIGFLLSLSEAPQVDRFARTLLLNNVGTVYVAANQLAAARAYFLLAERELGEEFPDEELTCVDRNLAELTSDAIERERLARRAWERTRKSYGENHARTLEARMLVARSVSDDHQALQTFDEVCATFQVRYPDQPRSQASCLLESSFLAWAMGTPDRELRLRAALAVEVPNPSTSVSNRRRIIAGALALERGALADAALQVEPLLAANQDGTPGWERNVRARAHLIAGLAQPERITEALIVRARDDFERLERETPSAMFRAPARRARAILETRSRLPPPSQP